VTCARACVRVADRTGREAEGWGETPLSVQWVWPSALSYDERYDALVSFCGLLSEAYAALEVAGHPLEIGHAFLEHSLLKLLQEFNLRRGDREPMPYLAALVCASPFDIALHDAFGVLHGVPTYETYNAKYMNRDLSYFLRPAADTSVNFAGLYPEDYLVKPGSETLVAWHMVGGMDWVDEADQNGPAPADNYPYLLRQWIRRDGLKCLKIKVRGDDATWDYDRVVAVGKIACEEGVDWLCVDFNCTATEVGYVNDILDRLMREQPRISGMLLYVEQPFPYDMEKNRIDVHSLSSRKPLLMDESAHDWKLVALGRELGWTGVALKTCKTQTGALLSLCWAKAHGMSLMVHDLSNPMLAQLSHALLAAYAGTTMGLETNAPQFYPKASIIEAQVHPGAYTRQNGMIRIDTLKGPGFGYQLERIHRTLPKVHEPASCSAAAQE
jgi:L-alanine-DL-glutamate epimerase-like enolase superfamily enzyme